MIDLAGVTNASGRSFDVNVEEAFRNAMRASLEEEKLLWKKGRSSDRFTLDLRLVEYRPGNAFQRWLLPGYGSTVLAVEGTVTDARSGIRTGTIRHERSVHFGGAYTVGAWSFIFDQVAADIARDLKVRIEKGGHFVVYLKPRADQGAVPQPGEQARKIKVSTVTDDRPDKGRIGTREAAFGVSMGDVRLGQRADETIRQALRDDLLAAGYRVVESGEDLTAEARLMRFWVRTKTTPLYWDVIGEIEMELAVSASERTSRPARRTFARSRTERTYAWPRAALLGKVLDACLGELMVKIRTDGMWTQPYAS